MTMSSAINVDVQRDRGVVEFAMVVENRVITSSNFTLTQIWLHVIVYEPHSQCNVILWTALCSSVNRWNAREGLDVAFALGTKKLERMQCVGLMSWLLLIFELFWDA